MPTPSIVPSLVPARSWLSSDKLEEEPLGWAFLVLVTCLGAAARFHALTGQSLWVDEVMSWAMMRPGAGLDYLEQVRDSIQGPLYLAITWPLLRLQDSELMLRLPSAVAGTLTVPLFALAAQRLTGTRAARLATLLLVFSPFHVWYSQEGRGYALLMFFAVAMGLLVVRMVQDGIRGSTAALFALCSAGAVWSNMSGLFLWGAMGLTVLLLDPPRSGRQWALWALAFGGGLVAVVPWVLKAAGIWAVDRLMVGADTGAALRGETTFTPLALPYSVFTFFYGYSLGPSLRELHQPDKLAVLKPALPLLAAAALPVGLALLSGLVGLRRRSRALLWWILVPCAVLILLAIRNVKPWNPRYVAVALPWLLALAGLGLVRLPRKIGPLASVLLVGLTLYSLAGYYWNDRYAKADVRQASRQIQQTHPRTPVLVTSVANVYQYYNRDRADVLTSYDRPPLANMAAADDFLAQQLAGRDELVYLAAREWYFDPHNLLPEALARQGRLELDAQLPGVTLYYWQRAATDKGAHE